MYENFINSIYDKLNFNHFTRFIILLLLSFLPLIYFFKKFNFYKKEIKILLIFSLLSFCLIFFLALDWARFLSLIFNLLIFFIVFSTKICQIHFDTKFKNYYSILFILIIYCTTWSPKTTFFEKINYLPPKDVIERIILYK